MWCGAAIYRNFVFCFAGDNDVDAVMQPGWCHEPSKEHGAHTNAKNDVRNKQRGEVPF